MKSVRGSVPPYGTVQANPSSGTFLSLEHLLGILRRQFWVITLCAVLGLALGLSVALTSTRLYTASSSLIIDPPAIALEGGAAASNDRGLDTGAVDSQIEVLRSDRIATAVVEALDLRNDPRLIDQPKSIKERLRELLPQRAPADLSPEEEARLLLVDIVTALDQSVWIARVGVSYVLKIDYTSRYPDLSAEIANAYVEAYLQDQISSRLDAARHAAEWLATRVVELRQRAFETDLAAQNFRAGIPPMSGTAPADGAAQRVVELRQLEREAETYRALYEVALGRHQDSIQQQTFPAASGRVISVATPPLRPSLPRKSLVLVLGLLAGTGAGVGLAALRELRDQGFRTGARVRSDLGLPCLGILPLVTGAPLGPAPSGLVRTAMLRHALDAPLAPFADTLRAALAAVDGWSSEERRPCVIGLVSALPDEGVTTTAANLALLSAALGARTLLVDGDLREAGLSRAIAPETGTGLAAAVADLATFDGACLADPETGLAVLPTVPPGGLNAGQALSPAAMQALLGQAEGRFDRVFIDLAPTGLFSDVRAVDPFLDGILLVVRWGKTPRALVRTLVDDAGLRRKIVGVLLSQVELDRVHLYADHGSPDFYRAAG